MKYIALLLISIISFFLFQSCRNQKQDTIVSEKLSIDLGDWYILGPFRADNQNEYLHYDNLKRWGYTEESINYKSFINIIPDSGIINSVYKQNLFIIDFNTHFGIDPFGDNVKGNVYAVCTFDVNDTTGYYINFTCDDGGKVFLNNEEIIVLEKYSIMGEYERYLPVKLKKGKNFLLIKVNNSIYDWQAHVKIEKYSEAGMEAHNSLMNRLNNYKFFSISIFDTINSLIPSENLPDISMKYEIYNNMDSLVQSGQISRHQDEYPTISGLSDGLYYVKLYFNNIELVQDIYKGNLINETKDDLCPAKLCITYRRERKYYSINDKIKNNEWQFLSEEDMKKVMGDSPRGKYRDIWNELKRIINEAENAIKDIPIFSFAQFEERYSYASSFESLLRALKEFHTCKTLSFNPRKDKIETREKIYLSGKVLRFVDINPSWLRRFEKWMQDKGKSKSTVGIYIRNIRVIFRLALKQGLKAEYPFTDHKMQKTSGRKIALSVHQISLIANYKTDNPKEQFYRDIFMFSFLANGMNLADIARLKYSNIFDNEIYFEREKTKRYKKNNDGEGYLRVPVIGNLQFIIDKYGNKAIGHDAFIFPILRPEWTEERKFAEVKQLVKQINKYIRGIALVAGIKEKISSYTARHSWATISKNSGTSTEFIKEALGHSNVAVTERYLKSFEKSTRKEHAVKIEETIYNQNAG